MKKISIAIDGPSAAGKSTIAKLVAKQLDYIYIDTGAMYRCVALYVIDNGFNIYEEEQVCGCLDNIIIEMDQQGNVFLNNKDVSQRIRADEISMAASTVSSYQQVREFLVSQQRNMAKDGGVILDGRDIGTVVLKNAELKIFQEANSKTRAKRRYLENIKRGMDVDLATIESEIEQRDYQDCHREHSPLRPAEDAIIIDTSDMSLEDVTAKVMELVEQIKEKCE